MQCTKSALLELNYSEQHWVYAQRDVSAARSLHIVANTLPTPNLGSLGSKLMCDIALFNVVPNLSLFHKSCDPFFRS